MPRGQEFMDARTGTAARLCGSLVMKMSIGIVRRDEASANCLERARVKASALLPIK